ncbi:DUF881 domain-containing protein [Propionibacteriaceae bacterium G1746]
MGTGTAPGPRRRLATRLQRLFRRAHARARRRRKTTTGRLASLLVVAIAALMATIGALSVRGGDPRAGNRDLAGQVQARSNENKALAAKVAAQREELDKLSKTSGDPALNAQLEQVSARAGASPVQGPAVKVVLDDAPLDVKPEGVDEDLLIVHQQDIQMVVNLFWGAGAEAMTVQGQRVISTTGIKCVGNSVVLHGIPYAPPYEIVAIGDTARLLTAIQASSEVAIYKQYAEAYRLGWALEQVPHVTMPGFQGEAALKYAKPPS